MSTKTSAICAALTSSALIALALAAVALSTTPTTSRISVKTGGAEAPGAEGNAASISTSGRFVSFDSDGSLVPADTNGFLDVYVRDRRTGRTGRISVKTGGAQVLGAEARLSSISAGGRYVAFESSGAFVPSDSNGTIDIFVRDRKLGVTKRATVLSNGTELIQDSTAGRISGNGRFVVFQSNGAFTSGDTNFRSDIFVHDMNTGKTARASLRSNGRQVGPDSFYPVISAGGRYVAFQSVGHFVPGDAGTDSDVFVRDRKLGVTRRVSVRSNGVELNGIGSVPDSISADGRYVAFDSSGKFVSGDTNGVSDVYVHDMQTGSTRIASVRSNGTVGTKTSLAGALSGSGRFVAFESFARLTGGDAGNDDDVFIHDMNTGATRRVSVRSNGLEAAPGESFGASIGGGQVAFTSDAKLTSRDDDLDDDVFVRGPLY